jgi:ATP-dependent RNA helicase DbpA
VGKISVFDFQSYVAVKRDVADLALARLSAGKIKGRSLRISALVEVDMTRKKSLLP